MKRNTKIVIIGGNHYNTLGLIRSLGEAGYRPTVFIEHDHGGICLLSHSRYISKIVYCHDEEDVFVELGQMSGTEDTKPIVFLASDESVNFMDRHYSEFQTQYSFFNAGQEGRIDFYQYKTNQFELASKCGLRLIKTWRSIDGNIPKDIIFPCFVKDESSLNGTKEHMCICHDQKELAKGILPCFNYLIQEYIEKDYELDINGISINHGADVLMPAAVRKLRETLLRQSDYIRLEALPEWLDLSGVTEMIRRIRYEGLFSVEFLIKGQNAYFLELNLRNDGVNHIYSDAGINMPRLWIDYAEGRLKKLDNLNFKLKLPITLMREDDLRHVGKNGLTFRMWIHQFLHVRSFFYFDLKDPMPFIFKLGNYVRRLCRRMVWIIGGRKGPL